MIKIPPCDLPMVPLVPMVPLAAEIIQGFLVTIGKNGTNSTIGRFTDFTIGRTPNVAKIIMGLIKVACGEICLKLVVLGDNELSLRSISVTQPYRSFRSRFWY